MINNINKPRIVGEKLLKPVTIAPPKTKVVIKEVSAPVKPKKKNKKK